MHSSHLRVEKVDFIAMQAEGDWTLSIDNPIFFFKRTDFLSQFLVISMGASHVESFFD